MNTLIAIRIAALGFGLMIITAVVIANLGYGESFWPVISHTRYADKVGHIGIFGIMGFLSNLALPNFRIRHLPRLVTAITFILFVLVSLEEISQLFIPARTCDIFDWLADVAGLAIGQIAATVLSHCYKTRPQP